MQQLRRTIRRVFEWVEDHNADIKTINIGPEPEPQADTAVAKEDASEESSEERGSKRRRHKASKTTEEHEDTGSSEEPAQEDFGA